MGGIHIIQAMFTTLLDIKKYNFIALVKVSLCSFSIGTTHVFGGLLDCR